MRSITRLIVCASGVLLTLWPPYGKECRYLRSWRSQKPKFGVSIVSIGCRFFEGQLAVTIYRFRKTPVSTVPYYGDFPVGDYETLSGEELSSPAPNAWRYSKDILPPGLIFIRDAADGGYYELDAHGDKVVVPEWAVPQYFGGGPNDATNTVTAPGN